jgi:hypothetical protein
VASQACAIIESEKPDFILVDFMFFAARLGARRSGRRAAAMAHMALYRVADPSRGLVQHLNEFRAERGFAPLPSFDEFTFSGDPAIVTSLAAIEQDRATPLGADVRYVGPALETESHAQPIALPGQDGDTRALALVSFSTDPTQAAPDLVQRTLDALGPLSLRVVATVGRAIDPANLAVPANAFVAQAAHHDPLMKAAALVVTHGGHGTIMRALKYGAPILVMPGLIPDQAPNAALVEELGAGRVLRQESSVAAIRAAAEDILTDADYRAKARKAAALFQLSRRSCPGSRRSRGASRKMSSPPRRQEPLRGSGQARHFAGFGFGTISPLPAAGAARSTWGFPCPSLSRACARSSSPSP